MIKRVLIFQEDPSLGLTFAKAVDRLDGGLALHEERISAAFNLADPILGQDFVLAIVGGSRHHFAQVPELVRRLRESMGDKPIIAVPDRPEELEPMLNAGCSEFQEKGDVLKRIKELLGSKEVLDEDT